MRRGDGKSRGRGRGKRKGRRPTRANSRCQSRPADLPSVVYVKKRYSIAARVGVAVAAKWWCFGDGDGPSGALAVAHSLWRCVWLHMLAVAANSWMMEPVLWVRAAAAAAARASPATSAIHTTNEKMSNKCFLFSLETQLSRSALPSGLTLLCRRGFPLYLLRCSLVGGFSTVLRPSAQRLRRPFVSVVCLRLSDYFMLLILFWVVSLW
jgi:hypothetical protein